MSRVTIYSLDIFLSQFGVTLNTLWKETVYKYRNKITVVTAKSFMCFVVSSSKVCVFPFSESTHLVSIPHHVAFFPESQARFWCIESSSFSWDTSGRGVPSWWAARADPQASSDAFIYLFFPFIFISWRLITLQYCSGFCHTLTWISHGLTCIPHPDAPSHLPLHLIPLGLPSTPGLSTCLMHPTWAGDLFHPR